MKRIVFGIALFVFSLALSVITGNYTLKKNEEILLKIEALETKIAEGTGEAPAADGEAILYAWKDAHAALCLYLSHDRLGTLDKTLCALPVYLRENDRTEALALCAQAKETLRALKEAEALSLSNVF